MCYQSKHTLTAVISRPSQLIIPTFNMNICVNTTLPNHTTCYITYTNMPVRSCTSA